MLMITETRDKELVTFRLAGALAGEWAAEFERCWHCARGPINAPHVVVDLAEVTFVDQAGKELLGAMVREGAELIARGILMKSIVEEIASDSSIAELT